MSLKQTRFHVEPMFNYRGDVMNPFFGEPDEYVERIVDWVKDSRCPQTYGCYTLFKVLHQQKRIDILEDTAEGMSDEIIELYDAKDSHDIQIQELKSLVETQAQELQRLRSQTREHTKARDSQAQELYSLSSQVDDLLRAVKAQATETKELRKQVNLLEPVLAQPIQTVEVVGFLCNVCGNSYSGNKCSCRISLMDSLRGY